MLVVVAAVVATWRSHMRCCWYGVGGISVLIVLKGPSGADHPEVVHKFWGCGISVDCFFIGRVVVVVDMSVIENIFEFLIVESDFGCVISFWSRLYYRNGK